MADSHAFPFALDPESINNWLAALEPLSVHDKVNQLYTILKKFSNPAIEAPALCSVLDQLAPAILMASNSLVHIATSNKASYAADKTRKLVHFSIQLIRTLCFAYCSISNDSSLTKAQQASIIYKAMQLACLLVRRNAVFYEAPDTGLWAKISELYLNAKALAILDLDIQDAVPSLNRQLTIEAVLKQTLLFSICNAYDFSPSEIADIFHATGKLCRLLTLDPNPSESSFFCWHPDSLAAPHYTDPHRADDGILYINTSGIIRYFESNTAHLLHYQTFLSTLNRLTAYEPVRESADPASPTECDIAIGTAWAAQLLKMLINRYRILELSGTLEEQSESAELELEPLEDGKNTFGFITTKFLKDERPAFIAKIRAFKTDSPYFYTAKISQDCAIGEPLVFIRENKKPLMAVIRYLRIEPVMNLKHILLEILDGDVYPIEINEKEGFIIKRAAGKNEIVLSPDNHKTGTQFSIDQRLVNGTFCLDKFIESTPHFMRFQVSQVTVD
ncbi:hypothetical protein [Methylobacter sp. YRD-M1]|uniref:hypothetical protein n=1 Tax=Methylobacter sp. YRD-M1 TaxID=2911520 RepID=UPI00227C6798|nr:hypothetical protein [Methylobacter sp. YRD-M1]WAK03045.1 hypothetical protein LZ558_04450 [Methylobacter sp. YRD-M1]